MFSQMRSCFSDPYGCFGRRGDLESCDVNWHAGHFWNVPPFRLIHDGAVCIKGLLSNVAHSSDLIYSQEDLDDAREGSSTAALNQSLEVIEYRLQQQKSELDGQWQGVVDSKELRIGELTDLLEAKETRIDELTDLVEAKDSRIANLTDLVEAIYQANDLRNGNLTDVVEALAQRISTLTQQITLKDEKISDFEKQRRSCSESSSSSSASSLEDAQMRADASFSGRRSVYLSLIVILIFKWC
jgi:chromosome segregation ATPase